MTRATPFDMMVRDAIPPGRWMTMQEVADAVRPRMPPAFDPSITQWAIVRLVRAGEIHRDANYIKPVFMREN